MQPPREPQLAFRPPVHRKHEREHGKRSPKPAQRKSVRTYGDVALHVMGSNEVDMTSLRSSISPSNSIQLHSRSAAVKPCAGNTSAESSLSRGTVSQTSSLPGRSEKAYSSNRKYSKKDSPFGMEGEIHESGVYEPPPPSLSPKAKHRSKKKANDKDSNEIIQERPELSQQLATLSENVNIAAASENSGIKVLSDNDIEISISRERRRVTDPSCITLAGTIKRGKKQDLVNVVLTPDEITVLNKATLRERKQTEKGGKCSCANGPHVLLLSLIYVPFAFIASLFLSFYTGSMCWYNIYIYLSEECTIAHKIFLCPLLIISYPIYIVMTSFCIAFYAMFVQVSWRFASWQREIKDLDKNFFGWMCNKMNIAHCAPYEIIILDDNAQNIESSECLDRD